MGDLAEDFRALDEFHKEERAKRSTSNQEKLKALGIKAYEQSKNVFRIDTHLGAVMYYPSSGTWQHRGKTGRGSVEQFRSWLKKNHFL